MKFNVHKFALAASISATIFSSFWHISMWFMHSNNMMGMMGENQAMMHGSQGMMARMFTPTGFLVSLLVVFLYVYFGAALFAWMYNWLIKKKSA